MISIIGGSYIEKCMIPKWDQLYGSGLRATIALSGLSKNLQLFTSSSSEYINILNIHSKHYNFGLKALKTKYTPHFFYLHPLKSPTIYPEIDQFFPLRNIEVKDKNVLKFGMIELNSKVNAENVVYDPQSPNNPESFHQNGSTARQLIYILNLKEARRLSGKDDITDIGKALLKYKYTVGVVVKCDCRGFYVFDKNKMEYYPPYNTEKIWLIGSGDIFSSIFSFFWLEKKLSIFESAHNASLFTAFYSTNNFLPLSKEYLKNFNPSLAKIKGLDIKGQLYLAGSFFNLPHLWLINEIRSIFLKYDVKIFSPFHDIGMGTPDVVAPLDLKALKRSKIVFALLDDRDPGTIFEIGYAKSHNIPVVIYTSNNCPHDLTMMSGTDCYIFNDLSTAIYKAIWILSQK